MHGGDRRAMIEQYRTKAREAGTRARQWKDTDLGADWEQIARSYAELADEIERLKH